MTDSKQVTSSQVNKMAKLAGWASVVNITSWLLAAIPGFLLSPWSTFAIILIPLSAMTALVTGIIGLVRKGKMDGSKVTQCVIGILVGVLNVLLIALVLVGIYAMVNCC